MQIPTWKTMARPPHPRWPNHRSGKLVEHLDAILCQRLGRKDLLLDNGQILPTRGSTKLCPDTAYFVVKLPSQEVLRCIVPHCEILQTLNPALLIRVLGVGYLESREG